MLAQLAAVQQTLLSVIRDVDCETTWESLIARIENPPWNCSWSEWTDYIPNELIAVWRQLAIETRIALYIMARQQERNAPDYD